MPKSVFPFGVSRIVREEVKKNKVSIMACNTAIANHTHCLCYDSQKYVLKYPLVVSVIIFSLPIGNRRSLPLVGMVLSVKAVVLGTE